MSVSPVMSPMISSYVPTSAKKKADDPEYQKILSMLKMLGISSTGDKETDKVLLSAAIRQMGAQKAESAGVSSEYIPFADVMRSLDLTSSGKVDKDYTNTINELDYRISMANDDEEKQYYQALRDEVDASYTENSYNNSRSNQYMGASQMADMNKYMLGL